MSHARQNRRIARAHATSLGALAGAEAVEDFANGGPCGDEEVTGADLLATIAPGQCGWDEAAINADAAGSDRCPAGFETAYYAAYEASARATVRKLAAAS